MLTFNDDELRLLDKALQSARDWEFELRGKSIADENFDTYSVAVADSKRRVREYRRLRDKIMEHFEQ